MFPLLVAVLLSAPRPSRPQDAPQDTPQGLLSLEPGPALHGAQPAWDPGPSPEQDVGVGVTLAPTDSAAEQPQVDARPSEADRQEKDMRGQPEDSSSELAGEQRAIEIPLTAGDSVATASELLPVPAPLSMGGRGPPMTLSLEDMDYLTILRPPQPPQRSGPGPGPGTKNKRKSNNKQKQSAKTVVVKQQAAKPTSKGKGRPKAPPAAANPGSYGPPPAPPAPPPPDSYAGFMGYGDMPPYGYGFGMYPHYPDPVMTPEYQQATSYPEEERFRPLQPSRPHLSSSPTAPVPAPTASSSPASASLDPYAAYHNRDYQAGVASTGTGAGTGTPQDQRPAAAVQVSQSVSAAEHHSTHAGWLSGPAGTSPGTAATLVTTSSTPADATATAKKATLKDILAQDCPGAEELGYCDSPPRYPMQQVSEAVERCSHLLEHMYAPPLDERDPEGESEGEGACHSVRRSLRPGYVRDVSSGRWLVALQARGRVVQKVSVERCTAPGRPCARLADSKCARNLGFRNGARATACDQRTALVPVITWDPEAPAACPRLRMARFPVACVCRML